MRRPARIPQLEPRCDAVTELTRSLESVPTGARWRVSWAAPVGNGRTKRVAAYLFHDEGARRWCDAQGIAFVPLPGPLLLAAPIGSAHDPDHATPRATGEAADPFADVRARQAGEHL